MKYGNTGFPTVARAPGSLDFLFDYVSYSSCESINRPNAPSALIAVRIERVIAAALDWGVAYVIRWNLFDSRGEELGLFDRHGNLTALGVSCRDGMSLSKNTGCGPASVLPVP